jgi:hypothetical protein
MKGPPVESDLIVSPEPAADKVLPRDRPSDTREVTALAREAEKYVVEIDPAFSEVLDGLDSAYKAGLDALNVLAEKINALKEAAVVKKPLDPTPTDPTPVDPTPVDPTPVSSPTPSPASAPASAESFSEDASTEAALAAFRALSADDQAVFLMELSGKLGEVVHPTFPPRYS